MRLEGRLEPSGSDFLLRGRLKGALELPCSRCLEPARLPVASDVSVMYVEQEPADDDEDEIAGGARRLTFEGGVIDLADELRDEILLAIPTQVLCKEDCRRPVPGLRGQPQPVPL